MNNNNAYRATLDKSAVVYVQHTLNGQMGTNTKTFDSNQAVAELSERLVDRFLDTLTDDDMTENDVERIFLSWCEKNASVISQIDRVTVTRTIMNNGNSITIGVSADRYPDMDLVATRAWLDLAIVKMLPQAITNAAFGIANNTANQQASSTTHNINVPTLIEPLDVDAYAISATLKGKALIRFFGGQWSKFGVPLYLDSDAAKELHQRMQEAGFMLNERHACAGTVRVVMDGDKPLKVSAFDLTSV
jgi:hypothetical protein